MVSCRQSAVIFASCSDPADTLFSKLYHNNRAVTAEDFGAIKLIDPLTGSPIDALVITADGSDEQVEYKTQDPESLSAKEIVSLVREEGVCGEPPVHIRLSPQGGKIDRFVKPKPYGFKKVVKGGA